MMTSILEPTSGNVLLLSILWMISGAVILLTLRKFKMRVVYSCFSALFLILGAYIPFYFLGTFAMNVVTVGADSSFTYFFLKHQLALLNAPFALFASMNFLVGIIVVFSVIALIIATVFVVEVVIKAIKTARKFHFDDVHAEQPRFVCHAYIPDRHRIYLVTRRLRN